MNSHPVPKDVGPTEDGLALRILWDDDTVCIYTPFFLRLSCPCAGCVDELTGEKILTADMIDDGVYPEAIHYVGRYALQFEWSDGHRTGIYPYDYLKNLCPAE